MPDKPLIQSPRIRHLIIALIMAGILALSLLAAAAFANRDNSVRVAIAFGESAPVSVGDFQTAVPIAWLRTDDPSPHAARFAAPDGDFQLHIKQLTFDDAANTFDILNVAVDRLDIVSSREKLQIIDNPEHFRHGTWTGMRIIGTTSDGNDRTIHHLAIMTENAQRFWAIHLEQSQASAIYESHALLKNICAVATDTGRRDATAADLAAAGLTWTPTGGPCVLRVDSDHVPGEAIDVIFLDSNTSQIARVVGSIAPPEGGPDEATLLADYFETRLDRAPADNERMAMNLTDGVRVALVRSETKASDNTPGYTWAQAFMSYTRGQSLAVQLLSSEQGDQPLRDMLETIATYLEPTWNDTLTDAGERAVATLSALTQEKTETEVRYYEMMRGDQPVGFGFERITADNEPYAWQGDALLVFNQSMRGPAVIKWRADPSGKDFSFIQLHRASGKANPGGFQLFSEGGQLSLKLISSESGEMTAWSVNTPPRFLSPIMMGYWIGSADAAWQGEPALITYADGRKKPQPFILQRVAGDVPMILLRSLVAVDADVMRLEADGSVAAQHYAPADRPCAPSLSLLLRKVERDVLTERYPHMRDKIEQWSEAADLTELQ